MRRQGRGSVRGAAGCVTPPPSARRRCDAGRREPLSRSLLAGPALVPPPARVLAGGPVRAPASPNRGVSLGSFPCRV